MADMVVEEVNNIPSVNHQAPQCFRNVPQPVQKFGLPMTTSRLLSALGTSVFAAIVAPVRLRMMVPNGQERGIAGYWHLLAPLLSLPSLCDTPLLIVHFYTYPASTCAVKDETYPTPSGSRQQAQKILHRNLIPHEHRHTCLPPFELIQGSTVSRFSDVESGSTTSMETGSERRAMRKPWAKQVQNRSA